MPDGRRMPYAVDEPAAVCPADSRAGCPLEMPP